MHFPISVILIMTCLSASLAQKSTNRDGANHKVMNSGFGSTHTQPRNDTGRFSLYQKRGANNRILNGTSAKLEEFPFTVFQYGRIGDGGYVCAGTLISSNVVLTAAHCLFDNTSMPFEPSEYWVSAGSVENIQKNTNRYVSSRLIPHSKFDKKSGLNDIGLIFLAEDIPSSIATPTKIFNRDIYDSIPVFAAGWGKISNLDSPPVSQTLQYVDINISSSETCSLHDLKWQGNNNHSICAQVVDGKSGCAGDSGGPLVANVNGLKPLVGITSGGTDSDDEGKAVCGLQGSVFFYTNAAYFISWINEQSGLSLSQLLYFPNSTSQSKTIGPSTANIVSFKLQGSKSIEPTKSTYYTKTTKSTKSTYYTRTSRDTTRNNSIDEPRKTITATKTKMFTKTTKTTKNKTSTKTIESVEMETMVQKTAPILIADTIETTGNQIIGIVNGQYIPLDTNTENTISLPNHDDLNTKGEKELTQVQVTELDNRIVVFLKSLFGID